MITSDSGDSAYSPLRDYLAALGRRKWYIVLAIVISSTVAVAYSLTQPERYEATAKVLLSRQDFAGALSGTAPQVYQDPIRLAQTQLEIARVPELARRVIRQSKLEGVTAESFLDDSRVVAASNADILEFTVVAPLPEQAEALATAYAVEFTNYRREVETAAFTRAEQDVRKRLRELRVGRRRRLAAVRDAPREERSSFGSSQPSVRRTRCSSGRRTRRRACSPARSGMACWQACWDSSSGSWPPAWPRRWTLERGRAERSRPRYGFRSSVASRSRRSSVESAPRSRCCGHPVGPRRRRSASFAQTWSSWFGIRIAESSW